jgi:ferric-dicitrate binding protein FerR (iron transport regulator)
MTGEAYFEVLHNKNAPFIVNSRKLNTTVLGTKFNIRANEDDAYITTTLLEGSIVVSKADAPDHKSITLKPNQQLKYDYNTGNYTVLECPSSKDYICWIDNKLYFENTKLSEIVKNLERHYNVNFTFASEKIKNETFTCDFNSNENIYQILAILKLTGKFDYKINGGMITLFSKQPQ